MGVSERGLGNGQPQEEDSRSFSTGVVSFKPGMLPRRQRRAAEGRNDLKSWWIGGLVSASIAIVAAIGLTLTSVAQQGPPKPGRAREVTGVTIGPSGQTGELHVFENPTTGNVGGATEFGPFRVLPAGAAGIPRPAPPEEATKMRSQSSDPAVWRDSGLAVDPPAGFVQFAAQATLLDSEVDRVDYQWKGPEGTVVGVIARVPAWRLPIDVYQRFPDSRLQVTTEMIEGYYAVIEEPKSGPAPNVGRVQVYVATIGQLGRGIVLSSPDMGQDKLRAVAASLARDLHKAGTP